MIPFIGSTPPISAGDFIYQQFTHDIRRGIHLSAGHLRYPLEIPFIDSSSVISAGDPVYRQHTTDICR
ncbi:hypothetical protein ACFOGI_00390 [Virgibacillus xinjiangensis]|uniref:Uncharacterized protein n=1 Tax=Virgibacillus xinjiangensis TaxID=393090 RepID=A0ABV7CQU0_9BACI